MKFKLILILSLTWFSACTPMWTGNAMQEDIEVLKKQQADLTTNLGTKQEELSSMVTSARADVAAVNKVLEEATALFQRNDADFGMEVETTRTEVQRLQGKVEELQFKLDRLQQDIDLFKEDTDMRFAEGGGAKLPEKAGELFKFAEKSFADKDYRVARKAYQTFLAKFPKNSNASAAAYKAGETLFIEQQWVSAVYEFQKVLQTYPGSKDSSSATFRIGQCFAKLGKCTQAAVFFESVVKDHPKSKHVSAAKSELQRAKAGNCK